MFTPMLSAFHSNIRVLLFNDLGSPWVFTSPSLTNSFLREDSDLKDLRDILIVDPTIEDLFYKYYDQWSIETRGISSSTVMYSNPNYLKIIEMGEDVIPILEKEIEKKTGRLMYALKKVKDKKSFLKFVDE